MLRVLCALLLQVTAGDGLGVDLQSRLDRAQEGDVIDASVGRGFWRGITIRTPVTLVGGAYSNDLAGFRGVAPLTLSGPGYGTLRIEGAFVFGEPLYESPGIEGGGFAVVELVGCYVVATESPSFYGRGMPAVDVTGVPEVWVEHCYLEASRMWQYESPCEPEDGVPALRALEAWVIGSTLKGGWAGPYCFEPCPSPPPTCGTGSGGPGVEAINLFYTRDSELIGAPAPIWTDLPICTTPGAPFVAEWALMLR